MWSREASWLARYYKILQCDKIAQRIPAFLSTRHSSNGSNGRNDWRERASLYVHWPYCSKRCTYCNFNKYIKQNVDDARMRDCMVKETQTLLQLSTVNSITSIFFGGGTPSLALPSTLAAVIDCVADRLVHNAEVSMEVNPTVLENQRLKEFSDAGVNRVSIGVQSLDDADMTLLGREHTADDSLRCIERARELLPGRVSVDMMYGLPGQTLETWQQQLQQILSVCDNHVSLYQLTLERGTALFKSVLNREMAIASPDLMADMYELAVKILEEHGYKRYEASNFAKEGAESEHNMSYWKGEQYIGVGPGAHGRFVPASSSMREARIQTLEPDPWMYEVEKHGHATRQAIQQTDRQVLEEVLMLGLRTAEGIYHHRWSSFTAYSLPDVFSDTQIVRLLQDEGYLLLDDNGLRCTHTGLNVVDSIVPELLNVLEKYFHLHELESSQ